MKIWSSARTRGARPLRLTVRARPGVALAAVVGVLVMAATAGSATEPRKVFSPIVEEGEYEVETVGTVDRDRKAAFNGGQAYTSELGYGVTSYWFTEFEGEFKSDPGAKLVHQATAWENVFQLTPQGEYWLDLGLLAEYEVAARRGDADELLFGPLLEKEFGDWLATINLILDKPVGANASAGTSLRYGVQLRYRFEPWLEPALEAYGEPGEIARFSPGDQQVHEIGPVLIGHLRLGGLPGRLKYEVGYLFGLSAGAPQGSVKWRLEYEVRF